MAALLEDLENKYLSEGVSEFAKKWNDERRAVLAKAVKELLLPQVRGSCCRGWCKCHQYACPAPGLCALHLYFAACCAAGSNAVLYIAAHTVQQAWCHMQPSHALLLGRQATTCDMHATCHMCPATRGLQCPWLLQIERELSGRLLREAREVAQRLLGEALWDLAKRGPVRLPLADAADVSSWGPVCSSWGPGCRSWGAVCSTC